MKQPGSRLKASEMIKAAKERLRKKRLRRQLKKVIK